MPISTSDIKKELTNISVVSFADDLVTIIYNDNSQDVLNILQYDAIETMISIFVQYFKDPETTEACISIDATTKEIRFRKPIDDVIVYSKGDIPANINTFGCTLRRAIANEIKKMSIVKDSKGYHLETLLINEHIGKYTKSHTKYDWMSVWNTTRIIADIFNICGPDDSSNRLFNVCKFLKHHQEDEYTEKLVNILFMERDKYIFEHNEDVSDIHDRFMKDIGTNILNKFTGIKICCRELDFFSSGILQFIYLQSLDLSCNNLTKLPNEIAVLRNLYILDLSKNRFTEVPNILLRMGRLSCIHICNNKKISYMPTELKGIIQQPFPYGARWANT